MSDSDGVIHILHIEDDVNVASSVGRVLKRIFGALVTSVASGPEAIKAIEQNPDHWAVILSDWNLKGSMNGGDIFSLVVGTYPRLITRYAFLSDDQNAMKLANSVGCPFLEKPAYPQDICSALLPMVTKAKL